MVYLASGNVPPITGSGLMDGIFYVGIKECRCFSLFSPTYFPWALWSAQTPLPGR